MKEKYGYLPTSVWHLKKGSELRQRVGEMHGALKPRRSKDAKYLPGLRHSSFNPDLAKRILEYWSNEGDVIVDPFAGHSTRMLVTAMHKRIYIGYEVGREAYQSLEEQAAGSNGLAPVILHNEDGCAMSLLEDGVADFIFTCPPFWNIETYEDAEGELSHCRTYEEFLGRLQEASNSCFRVLKAGKYMAWVVADFRKNGFKVLHRDVLGLFQRSGFVPWDLVINVLDSPFAYCQIGKCERNRYTSKTHEYVVVVKKP